MQLNITKFNSSDVGFYNCVAKNEVGLQSGSLSAFEIDPRLPTSGTGKVYGEEAPRKVGMEDFCPQVEPCPTCPDVKESKCKESIYSIYNLLGHKDIEIWTLGNNTYPKLTNRSLDCQVYAVGKPVFHRFTNADFGSWMRDLLPETSSEKYWVTKENDPYTLYEYANKTFFTRDKASKKYRLANPFSGHEHIIHNGSFYYNERNNPVVIKFDLANEQFHRAKLPFAVINPSNYLYQRKDLFLDFSVDENGLWVVYGLPGPNNTAVLKMDAYSLEIEYAWNISLKHQKVGDTFIVCGVLYAVDSSSDRNTNIRFSLDLYKNTLLEVSLPFTNPFRNTTMISYNHKSKELYTWDKGNQLTYPIRYHEIGYNMSKEEKEPESNLVNRTDVEINSD